MRAEERLREYQESSRVAEGDAAKEAAERRAALQAERERVAALEERLARVLTRREGRGGGGEGGADDERFGERSANDAAASPGTRASLAEKDAALAKAEAKLERMARDLAEAEEG